MRKHGFLRSLGRLLLGLGTALAISAQSNTEADSTFTITGKVVDAEGGPVAGATVERHQPDPSRALAADDPALRQTTTTDAEGAFELRVTRELVILVARKPGLGPAWRQFAPTPGVAQTLTLTPSAVLAGVVVDESDQPVAGAEVFVVVAFSEDQTAGGRRRFQYLSGHPARECFHAATDPEGRFRIEPFPTNATAALRVKAPGKALHASHQETWGYGSMPWQAGQEDIRLVVEPAGSIEGRIVAEEAAQPPPIARLFLQPDGPGFSGLASQEPAESAADGTFRIQDVAAGAYHIRAVFGTDALPDWVAEPVAVEVESGQVAGGVKIPATRGGVVEVSVLTIDDRKPLRAATVGSYRENHVSSTISDNDGVARLRLPPGDYQLAVNRAGWSAEHLSLTIEPAEIHRVEVQMAPLPKITGTLRRPDGEPAAGLPVMFIGDFSRSDAAATTDEAGRFEIEWDPNRFGRRDLTFCLLIRDVERNLAVAHEIDEDTGPLDLHLEPGLTLFGRVECDGQPVANPTAALVFWAGNSGLHLHGLSIATSTPGQFEIPALPPGRRYGLWVSAPGYGQQSVPLGETEVEAVRVELEPVELKPAKLELAGQVVDVDDQPVAGVFVHLSGDGQPTGNARTDRDGRFRFEQVCEGAARLSASARNSHGSISAEGGETNVVLRLGESLGAYAQAKPFKVTGTVTDPEGEPVAGAQVTVFPSGSTREVKTGADGAFNLTWRLEPWQAEQGHSALLVVRDPARNLAAAEDLDEDTPTLDIQLQPALTLTGRVEDPDESPLAGAEVGVWLLAARTYSQLDQKLATTDAQGQFEIRTLPAGLQYLVFASAQGRGRSQQNLHSDTESSRIEIEPFVLNLADQTIAGQVVDAKERPVAGVHVSLSGEGQPTANVTTDRQGRFSFKVCEGTVRLFASGQSGYVNASVEAGDTNVVLHLAQSFPGRHEPPRRPSLQGKALPELSALGLATDATRAGQRVLLCLMDVEQRPSRRVARLLAEQHDTLLQKGLAVIAAQVAPSSAQALEDWQAASPAPFPVGRVTETSEQTAWAASVESLPWLILTDTTGRVVAEGFNIEELADKLQATD